MNHAIYHDRYKRTPGGWRSTERVYEVKYIDTTRLGGTAAAARAGEAMDREQVLDHRGR
jgi:hypothetical protein